MALIKRKTMPASQMAEIENSIAKSAQVEDVTNALVELAALFAAQDDAIVELAEIISEKGE